MFFILSKIIWFIVQPSTLMVLALVYGLWRQMKLDLARGRRWIIGGTAAIVVVGLTPLTDLLIQPLEARFERADVDKGDIAGIIVLGGAEDRRLDGKRELMALNESAERITETAVLARRLPNARVVFSGGSDALIGTKIPEAVNTARLLTALGVSVERLTLEARSRNTAESAAYSKEIVAPKPGERWVLVTSAWHMPRSIGCFRAVGFEVEAWPVDYRSAGQFEWLKFHKRFPDGLQRLDFVVKEYVGLFAYRLTGRIGSLWPGQDPSASIQ